MSTDLPTTPTHLGIYPPIEPGDTWYFVADLRPMFPLTDGIYLGTSRSGNHEISDEIVRRLPADVSARVVFDPEYSGTYAYGAPDDLAAVIATVEAMRAEGWQ